MRVVLAPDKFKGCLSATEVASALAAGIGRVQPAAEITLLPVADGGDGTVEAALSVGFEPVEVDALGPTGEPVQATYGLRDGRAVIELADVVGQSRLPDGKPEPLTSSTYGLGVVIADALDRGVEEVVLGVGGSASTDGGAGMMQALGLGLLDDTGEPVARGGAALRDARSLDVTGLHERIGQIDVLIASDVDNPLLGPAGAAEVFGPQKGASTSDVETLEQGLGQWSRLVEEVSGRDLAGTPGAGAAGGTPFAALAFLGATIKPGIELILDLIGFADAVRGADLVVTGEGSLDEQSLLGKAPIGVSNAVRATGIPVVAVAGRCGLSEEQLHEAGIRAGYPLSDLEPDAARSIANAEALLRETGERIAEQWLT